MTAQGPWFVRPRPLAGARLRLLCLPHAGAGASSFFAWGAPLQAAGVELRAVQYPGRENRLAEPPLDSAPALASALADAWPELAAGGPCALFGHSMGALLSHELARELARRGAPAPARLFLSGRNPPESPLRHPPIHGLPDGELVRAVAERYGQLAPEILAEPEMVALLTPIFRADFKLVETYAPRAAEPLGIPLTILGGAEDPFTSADELARWRVHTRADCRVRVFPGGHFFHQQARGEVIAQILGDLAGLA